MQRNYLYNCIYIYIYIYIYYIYIMKLKNKTCKKKIKSKRSKRERRKKTRRRKMKGGRKVYRGYDIKNDDNKDGNNVEMVGGAVPMETTREGARAGVTDMETTREGARAGVTDMETTRERAGEADTIEQKDNIIKKLEHHIENMYAANKIKLKDIDSDNLFELVKELLREITYGDTS